jgi:hypothetical protein
MTDHELRIEVLKYSVAAARAGDMPLQIPSYLQALNLRPDEAHNVSRAIEYLVDDGVLEGKSIKSIGQNFAHWVVQRVTKAGYDAVEPPPGASKPQPNLTQHFSGPVGAVQIGDGNVAHVQQSLGENERAIIAALEALIEELRPRADAYGIVVLAESAVAEIKTSKTITEKAKFAISSIGTIVRTLGETPSAYNLLVEAAKHAHLLH